MAENIPNIPGGAVPPKKETGKVQPKKETVRINLPPKPSAAPTIKLPTLPPGGPTAAPSTPAPSLATAAPSHAPTAPRVGAAAPVASARPAGAVPAARQAAPVPMVVGPSLSPVDTVLAIAAAIVGLVAIGSTVFIMMQFNG